VKEEQSARWRRRKGSRSDRAVVDAGHGRVNVAIASYENGVEKRRAGQERERQNAELAPCDLRFASCKCLWTLSEASASASGRGGLARGAGVCVSKRKERGAGVYRSFALVWFLFLLGRVHLMTLLTAYAYRYDHEHRLRP
jgi:hypothetical protein